MKTFSCCLLAACLFLAASAVRAAAPSPPPLEAAAAEIDAVLEAHWKKHGLDRNPPLGDEAFVRRLYLDLAGRIPTGDETLRFLRSTSDDKRSDLIRDLLQSEAYVSRFFHLWADVLRLKSNFVNTANVVPAAYEKFIKESLRTNKPYDRFVYEMLSAKGYAWDDGAVGYYLRDPEMPLDNMALTARVFLGTRLECAQCHNHPFDKWKQTEFYRLAAYTYGNKPASEAFSGARDAIRAREQAILDDFKKEKAASIDGGKAAEVRKTQRLEAMEYRKIVGIIKGCVGQLFSPVGLERRAAAVLKLPHDFGEDDGSPFQAMPPAAIFGESAEVRPGDDPAEVFARWATSPKNPRFTRVVVNRLWKSMFGVPVTEAFDDLHDDTRAMIPELEQLLERLMIERNYDMKALLAIIAHTKAYRSEASHVEFARGDVYHFQGPILRRMTAEQMWDSVLTLASFEPDARDLARDARNERRIQVSKMAFEAYQNFDGGKLVDMAYARLKSENELQARERAVREALVVAKRNGDKSKELELRRMEGTLERERGEASVRDFILPLLNNLARAKAGEDAAPTADPNYAIHPNPRVLPTETWKRMHVVGYGPPPKTLGRLEAEARAETEQMLDRARRLGVPENERDEFVEYCRRTRSEWVRASELESPARRGHFLRTMGQSDRDLVENANPAASIPQALLLINSDLTTEKGLLGRYSPLMVFVDRAPTSEGKAEAVFLALLSRMPTPAERAAWNAASERGMTVSDLAFALLNSKQFMFVR